MKKKCAKLLGVTVGITLLSQVACASSTATDPQDPFENLNRHTFKMNDTLDKAILKPLAQAYNALPPPIPNSTHNFFTNLSEIPTVINDLLQFEFLHATADTWRFAINSTIGIGGLFDIANKMGLAPHDNDLGLTFAKWGYKSSAYFVIPILGPSTIRDGVATVPNYYLFTVYPHITPWTSRYALLVLNGISQRQQLLGYEGVVAQVSLDPYVFQRDAYLQYRNAQINSDGGASVDTYVPEMTAGAKPMTN